MPSEVTATMKIIDKFGKKIHGLLSTFNRIILKGHLQQFLSPSGKTHFLNQENIAKGFWRVCQESNRYLSNAKM